GARLLQEAARAGGPDAGGGADRPGDAVGLGENDQRRGRTRACGPLTLPRHPESPRSLLRGVGGRGSTRRSRGRGARHHQKAQELILPVVRCRRSDPCRRALRSHQKESTTTLLTGGGPEGSPASSGVFEGASTYASQL